MRIGIDCRLYGTRHRGIGRYTEQLVLNIAKYPASHQYALFVPSVVADALRLDPNQFTIVRADVPHYGPAEHLRMPRLIRRSGVDAMHFTHLNVPYWCPVPYVATIHDLIAFHFPSERATELPKWKHRIKIWGLKAVLKNAVKKARKVIAVSEFTKRDLVRHLNVPEENIIVTHLGVEQLLLGTGLLRNTPQFDAMLAEKFGIDRPYLLYVGSAYPHKNLEKLIDAYALLCREHRRRWQLVLAGREDAFYGRVRAYADAALTEPEFRRGVIFTGEVSDSVLDGLYRSAKCFVFPSRYEGFGLPPLEAALRGVPVVCSKAGSLPEVMAEGACYIDPDSASDIADKLNAIGSSHKVADEIASLGRERAKRFTWEKTAQETVDVYDSIVV
ncbi:MAG: glycosyltransferase family 4 protein [Parcubacteria group bacterium]|nr:glycosyltransferase family 4 protein [Parcubacteria group bacterium]